MIDQWLKFWRQWMCWWLPGGDQPEKDKPAQDPNQKTTSTPSETEAADVDAAATWRPAPGEPAVAKPQTDDLTEIKGIGPAIAERLNALGVRTFAELAAANPEELAEWIGRRPVTADRVRDWIAEAKKRSS
jgi:predicted flap endonuclease-1-like 5' DNA nuclease